MSVDSVFVVPGHAGWVEFFDVGDESFADGIV